MNFCQARRIIMDILQPTLVAAAAASWDASRIREVEGGAMTVQDRVWGDVHSAAFKGDVEQLRFLQTLPTWNAVLNKKEDVEWLRPIHQAVLGGTAAAVEFLLGSDGVQVSAQTYSGRENALHIAARGTGEEVRGLMMMMMVVVVMMVMVMMMMMMVMMLMMLMMVMMMINTSLLGAAYKSYAFAIRILHARTALLPPLTNQASPSQALAIVTLLLKASPQLATQPDSGLRLPAHTALLSSIQSSHRARSLGGDPRSHPSQAITRTLFTSADDRILQATDSHGRSVRALDCIRYAFSWRKQRTDQHDDDDDDDDDEDDDDDDDQDHDHDDDDEDDGSMMHMIMTHVTSHAHRVTAHVQAGVARGPRGTLAEILRNHHQARGRRGAHGGDAGAPFLCTGSAFGRTGEPPDSHRSDRDQRPGEGCTRLGA
jgi:hypothetical protein